MESMDGECSGKRRSTPVPKLILLNQEGLAQAGALTSDHHTGEGLDTGVVAFLDLDVDVDGVAGTERRHLLGGLHVLGVKCLNSVNHRDSLVAAAYQRTGLGFGDDWHHEHSVTPSGLPSGSLSIRRNSGFAPVRSGLMKRRLMRRPTLDTAKQHFIDSYGRDEIDLNFGRAP